MNRVLIILFLLIPFLTNAQLVKELKKTIELVMPKKAGDELCGTRGAGVAWHPGQKKYYAAFAGNTGFPLAVFNESGKRLSDEDLTCMNDLRGIWYNSKTKMLSGNGFNELGWFSYTLDMAGIPTSSKVYAAGMNQPGDQSVGTYNAKADHVYFLEGQRIYVYTEDGMQDEDSTIRLYAGINKKEAVNEGDPSIMPKDYNSTFLAFTGISKAELAILNTTEKQVELYNRKTGLLTQKLRLPADLPTWDFFNFSYSNGTYWAFDQETRTWTGYK